MNTNIEQIQELRGINHDQRKYQRTDRRTRHSSLNIHALRGRRKAPRRNSDNETSHYTHSDRHEPHIFWATLLILLLCVFDAHYTLLLIDRGGEELNQLMDLLIQHGMFTFIVGKYTLTALSLFILVAHSKFHMFQRIKVHHLIYGFLLLYTMLVAYELYIWPAPLSAIYGL